MDNYIGTLAVVTGGGSGIGRELALRLAARGASVAVCDVDEGSLNETAAMMRSRLDSRPASFGPGRVTAHVVDVSDIDHVKRFVDEVASEHSTDAIDILINNAGIGGGHSFVGDSQSSWERTFAVTWGGTYLMSRAFLPLLVNSRSGVLINVSSINGLWAATGPGQPNTAYSAAKFAVRGFTESLIDDFRAHAPHLRAVVVLPGHVGTNLVANSRRAHLDTARVDTDEGPTTWDEVARASDQFRRHAPVTASGAAETILGGVIRGEWRILIGSDALAIDAAVRAAPEAAYSSGLALESVIAARR